MRDAISSRPLIFGEVLFDRFPDGSAVLGGAPFNVAWHLQAFGAEPLMVSRVGEDASGQQVLAAMQGWGMDCCGMQRDAYHPTGSVEVSFVGNEPHYDIVTNRAYDFIETDALPVLPGKWLLYHGSLGLRNPVAADALAALKATTQARIFFDVNLRQPWWNGDTVRALAHQAHWVKLNESELESLVPEAVQRTDRLQQLTTDHTEYIVLTRGEQGAEVVTRETGADYFVRPQRNTEVVDTVGAGDAFCSVLILGLIRGWNMPTTLERAQQFASAVVGLRGATTQDKSFYERIMNTWNAQD